MSTETTPVSTRRLWDRIPGWLPMLVLDVIIVWVATLFAYWVRFGGPEGDISDELADRIRRYHKHDTDEEVSSALIAARNNICLEWLADVETRIGLVATVLAAELRGLLRPTPADGAVAQYWSDEGLVAVMGGEVTPESIRAGLGDDVTVEEVAP